jgi:hypothetical protein
MPLETKVSRARQVYGDGRDVSEFDLSLIVPMVLVPLLDVLAADGEQARRDAFEMTVGDRFE